jgi:solute carrier family 41
MIQSIFNISSYNVPLLVQSIPGMLISLPSLYLTGRALTDATENGRLAKVPIILEANCILSFKGNIELIFAMCLSSMSQSPLYDYRKYVRYAFDNSNLVLAQSTIIGFTIGLLGIAKSVLLEKSDVDFILGVVVGSMLSCLLTSIAFIAILVMAIEISQSLRVNPDNIILPSISSVGDFLNVRALIYFTEVFRGMPARVSLSYIFIMFLIVLICLFFAALSKRRLPLQSLGVLGVSYIISTVSGYVLETFNYRFKFLANVFPVFSGMSASIGFIYLHKIFTSISNQTPHNSRQSYITLLFISLLMGIVYLFASAVIGSGYGLLFGMLFVVSFTSQVLMLLKIVECLIVHLDKQDGSDTGVLALPVLGSISDFLSVAFLLAIATFLDLVKPK